MAAIESLGLTRFYGDLCAVDHLDLTVEEGELLAFLGPNGAGKTTTIRMLTGLIHPTEGGARVAGYDVLSDAMAVKERVGVVPQRSNLYAELSARDNLVFMAQLYGLPRRRWRERADELLAAFGLADRAGTRFGALSGGLKRRLTIAAALVHRPAILFLDEPTTGLDVQSARAIRQMIAGLRDGGVTVFLTTHLIPEAETLADRVAIIVRGKLVALDTPAALCAAMNGEEALEVVVPALQNGLAEELAGLGSVRGVSRSGDRLYLSVRSVDEALCEVPALIRRHGGCIQAIRTVAPSLEDAFVQITHLDAEAMQGPGARGGPGQARSEGAR